MCSWKPIPTETLTSRAHEALSRLGDSLPAIAKTLHAYGIKGHRGSFNRCPIAVYLSREFAEDGYSAMVQIHSINLAGKAGFRSWVQIKEVPAVVEEFNFAFDCGHYPELKGDV